MAAYSAYAKLLPQGVNNANRLVLEVVLSHTAAANDTIDVAYPDGVPITAVPIAAVGLSVGVSPNTYQPVTMTSFDPTAAVAAPTSLILTVPASGSAFLAGDKIFIDLEINS